MVLPKDPIKAQQVREKYRIAALNRPNAWIVEDISILKRLIESGKTHIDISKILRRTPSAIRAKAHKLGIVSIVNLPGVKNVHFKGERAQYKAVHMWVRKHKPIPKNCELCGTPQSKLEVRSISREYSRDLSDWEYVCLKCHRCLDKHRDGLNPQLYYRHDKNLGLVRCKRLN